MAYRPDTVCPFPCLTYLTSFLNTHSSLMALRPLWKYSHASMLFLLTESSFSDMVLLSLGSCVPRNDSKTRSPPTLWLCCLPHVAFKIITLSASSQWKGKTHWKRQWKVLIGQEVGRIMSSHIPLASFWSAATLPCKGGWEIVQGCA